MLFEAIYFFVFAILVARSNPMKEHHWLSWCWLYLLLCNNLFLCQDSCRKIVFLEPTEDAALQNHLIRTIVPSVSEHFCRVQCYLENECVSYNYGQEKCQLNNSTAAEHPLDLKAKRNFIYRGIQTSTNVRAVKPIHAKMAAHVLMSLGHSSVNAQRDSLALDAKQLFLNVRATSLSMHRIETWTSKDRGQNVTTISQQNGIVFKAKQENNWRLNVHQSRDVTPI
ncbi:uncharacterized protein LOC141859895 [Acropora palmata]|uniref:uncharacterized protein LOC141859895 n=1 Tax=Acropora palmata TaxID=6131 RepID=UPI003DA04EE0